MASIRDVAQKAGVSPTTVSRTFRSPDLLTEQTRHNVLDAAKQLGYRPRGFDPAKGTISPKRLRHPIDSASDSIGFLFFANIPEQLSNPHLFYAPVLAGAQREAAALGLHLLVHTTDLNSPNDPPPLMTVERAVSGLLLVGAVERDVVERFRADIDHVVLVDNRDDTGTYESVASDGFSGGLAAVRHLIDLGHRRIGFVTARQGATTFQDRLRGYWCSLLEAGITPDMSLLFQPPVGEREDSGLRQVTDRLLNRLRQPDPPTAILAANDSYAARLQRVLQREGYRIPEDISLVGFDDSLPAMESEPPLTTVRVDREAMGRFAVRRLQAQLHPDSVDRQFVLPRAQHRLPVSLIVRESSAPPRGEP